MKLSVIALKNLKRNFSFYSLYLFSVSIVLMIFFCFTSFSMNQVIMDKISSDGRVQTMCGAVSVFIMAFVIFYMFYSNNFFMRRRMKELGTYALLGYRKSAMLALLTFENIFICIGGMAVGIIAGSLLHKGITAGIVALLALSIDNSAIPLINHNAVRAILKFILVVLVTLTLSNAKLLRQSRLLDLVGLEKKVQKPIRPHIFPALSGVALLILGYGLSLDIMRGSRSIWVSIGFSPIALLTLLCVVSGTSLFIYSFLPCACQAVKRRKGLLYRENTIIVVPKFMHRMRSNAKSLILLILLAAGTLAVFGTTALSMWYPYRSVQRLIPSAIEYRVTDEEEKISSLQTLSKLLGESGYMVHETKVLKVTATSDYLPVEYSISQDKGRLPGFECISQTDFNTLLAQQGRDNRTPALSDSECILIKYRPDPAGADLNAVYRLQFGSSEYADITVIEASLDNPIGFSNSVGTLVVSDGLYRRILPHGAESFTVISVNGPGMRSDTTVYSALKGIMPDNVYLMSSGQREAELIHLNSPTFLLICFATVIFMIATGSILYFQNISSVTYDKSDYQILQRMGYNHAMIKRSVRRQIQVYYLIPYIMGVLHSIFAIICYKSALMDDLLGQESAFLAPVLLAIVLFSIIYFVFYQITKYSCYKIALK